MNTQTPHLELAAMAGSARPCAYLGASWQLIGLFPVSRPVSVEIENVFGTDNKRTARRPRGRLT